MGRGTDWRESAIDLARGFVRDGLATLRNTRGAFVVLLVFPEAGRVICARDAVGGRTAHYRISGGGVLVSDSSHRVAQAAEGRAEDPHFIANHFALRPRRAPGATAFDGVSELLPGQRLDFGGGRLERSRAHLAFEAAPAPGDDAGMAEAFGYRFRKAVEAALPVEGDAAIMLSGGMDSGPSAIVGAAALRARGNRLHAVSWRLSDLPAADESRWIRALADAAGIEVNWVEGRDYPPFSGLGPESIHPDGPSWNPFRPLVAACYARTRELGLDTLLNASAGDHLYPHPALEFRDLIRRRRLLEFTARIARRAGRVGPRGLYRDPAVRALVRSMTGIRREAGAAPPEWMTAEAARLAVEPAPWPPESTQHPFPRHAAQIGGLGLTTGIAREAAFAERFAIERYDPFCDRELIELALSIPPAAQFHRGLDKWVMRESMRGHMPEPLRLKKRTGRLSEFFRLGFEAHLPAIRERLLDSTDWCVWVDRAFVEGALTRHSSPRERLVVAACIGYTLWKAAIAEPPR